jgi:hypothetical protein
MMRQMAPQQAPQQQSKKGLLREPQRMKV